MTMSGKSRDADCLWSVAVLDISALSVDLLRLFSLRARGMCIRRSASHCFPPFYPLSLHCAVEPQYIPFRANQNHTEGCHINLDALQS